MDFYSYRQFSGFKLPEQEFSIPAKICRIPFRASNKELFVRWPASRNSLFDRMLTEKVIRYA